MSHEYRENLERRIKAGKAPHMKVLLNHYAFGRPRAEMEIQPPKGATLGEAMKNLTEDERKTLWELAEKMD